MAGDFLRLSVRCDDHAPRVVRSALADLPELGWIVGDAMLVASELVTNAVRHSGCSEEEDLIVSVMTDDGLRIVVADPGTSDEQAEIKEREFGFGGLGLRIVEELAEAWGTERQPEGKVVWAALPAPADNSQIQRAASWSEEAESRP